MRSTEPWSDVDATPGAPPRDSAELWSALRAGQLREFLDAYCAVASRLAAQFMADRHRELAGESALFDLTTEEAARLIHGGKKIRGALLILGYGTGGGGPAGLEPVARASIGYEFIHNGFLVHDDIMDRGELRRGRDTAWVLFQRSLDATVPPEEAQRLGRCQAIILGDLLSFWGQLLIVQPEIEASRTAAALAILQRALQHTFLGQTLDLEPGAALDALAEEAVLHLAQRKTACYSFVAPLQIGAVLAGADPLSDQLCAIDEFGMAVGLAFQIQDDILGMYADDRELGKSVLSDLREGKKTLLVLELSRRLADADRAALTSMWGNRRATLDDLERVRRWGVEVGAYDAVRERGQQLVDAARRAIPRISGAASEQALLASIAASAMVRQR